MKSENQEQSKTQLTKEKKTSELIELPEYIQAEVFLENTGFFTPSSKTIKSIYTKTKKMGERQNLDGSKKTIKIKISANHELGLPITSDFDYYRAFLKICDEIVNQEGRFQLPIAIPTRRLIKHAGKTENKRVWKEVKEWFKRMTWTGIEGGIYSAKSKNYQEGFTGTVFSQVILRGEKMRSGRAANTNYVWPSPWFLSNYYYRYIRAIDFNFYRRLRKPIAKSLYPILETGWYASGGKPYSKSYHDLCEEFLLTENRQVSTIKRQLDPAHKELHREGFLEEWEYRKSADKSDFVITYKPGVKFFQDQKAREARRLLVDQINGKPKELARARAEDKFNKELLLEDILKLCGDRQNKGAYMKVINEYPENIVRIVLSETRQASRERRIKKNRGAYFMDTLKRIVALREKAKKGAQNKQ